jgi:uncharacterized protein
MRTSDYTIIVDLPDGKGSLLVHGYTGAFDAVQPQVADYLRALRDGDANRPAASDLSEDTYATLRRRGYLTQASSEQERAFVTRLADRLQARQLRHGGGFLIIPTYNCNLRCTYCYERLLHRNGRAWLETRMTQEVVDAAYAAMQELSSKTNHPNRKAITLYGGEPLLAENRDLIEYIVARGREQGYVFGAITNGVDLDHFLDLLGPEGIHNLQITLDGPPETHDRRRVHADGSGSFAAIAANVSLGLHASVTISLRMNVDRRNVAAMDALAQVLAERGWPQHKNFSAYISPVHHDTDPQWAPGMQVAELQEAYRCALAAHPELQRLIDPFRSLREPMGHILFGGDFPSFRPSYCGANTGMAIFDPFGDFYPCWDVVGRPEFRTGSFFPHGLQAEPGHLDEWLSRTIAVIPECRSCPYALFCGGGCTSLAYQESKRFDTPKCRDFPAAFRSALPALYQQRVAQRKPSS